MGREGARHAYRTFCPSGKHHISIQYFRQRRQLDATWSQYNRSLAVKTHDGTFQAYLARSAIQNHVQLVAKLLAHMRCRCRTDMTETIRRWGGQRSRP
jgi:hypothetical protein